jgi:hypothetical protein
MPKGYKIWAILEGYRKAAGKYPNTKKNDARWVNVRFNWVWRTIWEMGPSANRRQGRLLSSY